MSILLTADFHLDDNPSAEYRWKIFDLIKDIYKDTPFHSLYILGDLTNRKNNHDAKLVERLVSSFEDLAFFMNEVIILKGNHDYTDEDSPFFLFLSRFNNIEYISKENRCDRFSEQWLPNTKNFNYTLDENAKYIFMHQSLMGSKVGNTFLKSGLDSRMFDSIKTKTIFSGDIHYGQEFGNVTYVGAPYHINFGDAYEGRLLLINDTGEIEELKTDKIFPSKLKLDINGEELMEMKSFMNILTIPRIKTGDFIKTVIHVNKNDTYKWDDFKKKIKEISLNDGLILSSSELKLVESNNIMEQTITTIKNEVDEKEIVKKFFEKENLDDFYLECAKEVMNDT